MSYDVEVWSVRAFQPSALRVPDRWERPGPSQWILRGRTWQIAIYESDAILPEDIPDEVARLIPGIQFLTRLHLEGKGTGEAHRMLRSTATDVAKTTHGVVADQQDGTIRTPSGVERFVAPQKEETFSVLRMSWWFLSGSLLTDSGRDRFLALLERLLPEAMPKRYGDYEPPQHVYAKTGRDHLLRFLGEPHQGFVWYPHRPAVGLHLGLPDRVGASRRGFRSNLLEIEVEAAALSQPGWASNLRLVWRETSRLIRPFFGEVRTFGGRIRKGAAVFVKAEISSGGPESDILLNRSWWWRGIPNRLGQAAVLGEPYQGLWPAFVSRATLEDGLAFASTPDWSKPDLLTDKVPESLATRPAELDLRRQQYPKDWPFGSPFI